MRAVGDGDYHAIDDVARAVEAARRAVGPDDLLCITGSFYLAGDVKSVLEKHPPAR